MNTVSKIQNTRVIPERKRERERVTSLSSVVRD